MPGFPAGVHLKGGQNAAPVLAELAREFYAPSIPVVLTLHGHGLSLGAIARELESRRIKPNHGCQAEWSAVQVRQVLARGLAAAESLFQNPKRIQVVEDEILPGGRNGPTQ
jgi:hypothetical protein